MLLSKLECLRFEGDERRRSALESLQLVAPGFLGCRTLTPFRTGDPARIQVAAPSGIWGKSRRWNLITEPDARSKEVHPAGHKPKNNTLNDKARSKSLLYFTIFLLLKVLLSNTDYVNFRLSD
jgi:hypothetical protein